MINTVTLVGNLTRDPEASHNAAGFCILKLGIAVNDRRKNQGGEWEDVPYYFDLKILGKRAESLSTKLEKGQTVAVQGKLLQDRWKDKEGNNRSRVYVLVDDIRFMSGKQSKPAEPEMYDEDIPF